MASTRFRLLFFFLAVLFTTRSAVGQSPCPYPYLPTTFNDVAYLGFDGAFHVADIFRANFSSPYALTTFSVESESHMRIYVAPNDVDVDLYLYDDQGVTVAHSSLVYQLEEVLHFTVEPDRQYTLEWGFYGHLSQQWDACSYLYTEIEFVTKDMEDSTFYPCTGEILPPSTLLQNISDDYEYSGDFVYNSTEHGGVGSFDASFFSRMDFTVPSLSDITIDYLSIQTQIWHMQVDLEYDFLTGGSLGVLVVPEESWDYPTLFCQYLDTCNLAVGTTLNTKTLEATLQPGNYSLVLFDVLREHNFQLSNCTPFHLDIRITTEIVEETPINCPAPRLPASLNQPGFVTDDGYLQWSGPMFMDFTYTQNLTTSLTVSTNSYFRVFLDQNGVDLQLVIRDSEHSGHIATSSNTEGTSEAIILELIPGTYYIDFIQLAHYEYTFCHTFDVVFAMAPVDSISVYCQSEYGYFPDLTDMSSSLHQTARTYSLEADPIDPYEFYYSGNYTQQVMYTQSFSLISSSTVQIQLGMNFLVGDATFRLVPLVGTTIYAQHFANVVVLETVLSVGSYTLELLTGTTQTDGPELPDVVDCLIYTLSIEIAPVSSSLCTDTYPSIPATLNSPSFLSSLQWVYIDSKFSIPATEEDARISFDVKRNSQLRVTASESPVVIGFELYSNGILLATSTQSDQETASLSYHLTGETQYQLQVTGHDDSMNCDWFRLELGISPDHTDSTDECVASLPSPSIFEYEELPYAYEGQYAVVHPMAGSAFSHFIEFQVESVVYFRLQLLQDFMSSNITSYLLGNVGTLSWYNHNQFGILYPGNYTIELVENGSGDDLHTCDRFSMMIAFDPVAPPSFDECAGPRVPTSLNEIAYMSSLSGQMTHYQEIYVVDDNTALTTFEIDQPYYLRASIGRSEVWANTLKLLDGDNAVLYTSQNGVNQQTAIYYYLDTPATYSLQLSTAGIDEDCHNEIEMEVQLMLGSLVDSVYNSYTSSSCASNLPSSTIYLQYTPDFYGEFQYYHQSNGAYSQTITLEVEETSSLYIELGYYFLESGMDFALHVMPSNGAIPYYIYAKHSMNVAYLETTVASGSYHLMLSDGGHLMNSDHQESHCVQYSLRIYAEDILAATCSREVDFPTDLYSDDGGSTPYGGPQNENTGQILFTATFFQVPSLFTHYIVRFKVPLESYVAVYAAGQNPETVIISTVRSADGGGSISPIFTGSTEWLLESSSSDYILDLFFSHVPSDLLCELFNVQVDIKPTTTVEGDVDCPLHMPNPSLPNTQYALNDNVISYGNYIFNSSSLAQQGVTTYKGVEYLFYTMQLVVGNPGVMHTYVGYDMIYGNFKLVLGDQNDMSGLASGNRMISPYIESDVNIRDSLSFEFAQPQDVFLSILVTSASNPFDHDTYCLPFEFSISFTSILNSSPQLIFVDPPGASSLRVDQNLAITLYFSEPVASPPAQGLLDEICNSSAIYLYDSLSESSKLPSAASYVFDQEAVVVVFSAPFIEDAYQLILNLDEFRTISDEQFSVDESEEYLYDFHECDCNGHGVCTDGICACDLGYAGSECQNCDQNYHPAGDVCMQNQLCTEDTCNGHGTCRDSSGYFHCNCDPGWATTGNEWCTICANGYIMQNGDCIVEPDAGEHGIACYAPLLPSTFDTIGYLQYDGSFHISDNYFADTEKTGHNTTFTLEEETAFRLTVDASEVVDVSLYLYQYDNNILGSLMVSSTNADWINSIYSVLLPGKYIMEIRYSSWDLTEATDCNTIHLEAEMRTLSTMANSCPSSASLPLSGVTDLVITSNYYYNTSESFWINKNTVTDDYFWSFSFTIGDAPENTRPQVSVQVGYEFLVGKLAFVLERTSDDHCGELASTKHGKCEGAKTYFNEQIMVALVEDGHEYTMWLYSPDSFIDSVTTCSEFTFAFSVEFVDLQEGEWFCKTPGPPEDLTAPELVDNNGRVHLADAYYITENTLAMNLNSSAYFRIALYSQHNSVSVYYQFNGGDWVEVDSGEENDYISTALLLNAGSYNLRIVSQISEDSEYCQKTRLEVAIDPDVTVSCHSPQTILPDIESDLITVPYTWGIPTEMVSPMVYSAYYNDIVGDTITSFSFSVDQPTEFAVGVASNFLVHNLKVVVSGGTLGGDRFGSTFFNYNFLQLVLEPGTYTVSILRDSPLPGLLMNCVDFNLMFTLQDAEVECGLEGEPLPSTLQSIRFLQTTSSFNYRSAIYSAPAVSAGETLVKSMSIQVEQTSILRVYIDQYNALGVGLVLNKWVSNEYVPVVDTLDQDQDDPQEIAEQLDYSASYRLDLVFTYNHHEVDCPQFSMEIGVAPVYNVANPPYCPNSGSYHFNPTFPDDLPNTPWHYDSQEIGESLYYQEIVGEIAVHTNTFVLEDNTDFYARITYDFLAGDLVLILVDTGRHGNYRGTKYVDMFEIREINLPAGSYELQLYQLVPNIESIAGCIYFEMKIDIEPTSYLKFDQVHAQYPPLPVTLNTVNYLGYDGAVHFDNSYLLKDIQYFPFTLTNDSYFRAVITNTNYYHCSLSILSEETQDTVISSASGALFTSLTPGNYTLLFIPYSLASPYYFQLAIDSVQNQVNAMSMIDSENPSCSTSQFPSIMYNIGSEVPYAFGGQAFTISSSTNEYSIVRNISVDIAGSGNAYFYAHIGYQFLPGSLRLELVSGNNELDYLSTYHMNQAEIYVYLPAGSYTLRIKIDLNSVDIIPPHCTVFSLLISISDGTEVNECFDYLAVPYDLNDPSGGSAIYGGPIEDGSLTFYGPSFSRSPNVLHVEEVSMQIRQKSVLSIYTNAHSSPLSVSFMVYNSTSPLPFSYQYAEAAVEQQVYLIDYNTNYFYLDLFDGVQDTTVECPTYALQILLELNSVLESYLDCPSTIALPSSPVPVNGQFYDWVQSSIPYSSLNQWISHTFTVSEDSWLSCTITYDARMVYVLQQLSIVPTDSQIPLLTGNRYPETVSSTITNMATTIESVIAAGSYSIQFKFATITGESGPILNINSSSCVPYTYSLTIYPDSGNPFVESVDPSSAQGFPQGSDLVLDITFSDDVYSTGNLVFNLNKEPMYDALYLQPGSSPDDYIGPISVFAIGDSSFWRVRFQSEDLQAGETYLLGLHPGILTNHEQLNFYMPSEHVYTIQPNCSGEHQHYNEQEFTCDCDVGYLPPDCDQCIDGYSGYPNCTETGVCDCAHGYCDDDDSDQCVCDLGWAGDTCNYCDTHFTGSHCSECTTGWSGSSCNQCASNFLPPDCTECSGGWTGSECNVCGSHYTGANCDTCMYPFTGTDCNDCVGHFTGNNCNQCDMGWAGTDCDVCDSHFTGSNCDQCMNGWTGPSCTVCDSHWQGTDCDQCAYPFTGTDCDDCLAPFTGADCTDCMEGYAGDSCTACAPHFTGDSCDQCIQGWDGPNCDQCAAHYTGTDCDECEYPFTGTHCSDCADNFDGANCTECKTGWTGSNCDQCASHFTGTSCSQCTDGWTGTTCSECDSHWTGSDCDQCAFPYSGPSCTDCQNHYTGSSCQYCETGWDISTQCTTCADHFQGENCDSCTSGWAGTQCDYCGDHWEGLDCDRCATNWVGENCEVCPSNFVDSPGDCTECAPNWTGPTCSECADGFSGADCLVQPYSNTESSNNESPTGDSFIYQIGAIIIALIVLIGIIIAIFFVVFFMKKRHVQGNLDLHRPILDLDDGDVEMETNPMLRTGGGGSRGELLDYTWNMQDDSENMNTGDADGLNLDDEYAGALDLDDLDEFSPEPDSFLDDDDFNPRE